MKNEFKKFKNPWKSGVILLLFILFLGIYESDSSSNTENNEWRTSLKEENEELSKEMEVYEDNEVLLGYLNDEITQNNLYLNHNISPYYKDAWIFVNDAEITHLLLSMLLIIISIKVISTERIQNTFPTFFITGLSPKSILKNKIAYVNLIIIFALIVDTFLKTLIGMIFFDVTNPLDSIYFFENNGSIQDINSLEHMVITGLSFYIESFVMCILGMVLALFIKNWFISFFVTLGFFIFAPSVLMNYSEHPVVKLSIFSNIDISNFLLINNDAMIGYNLPIALFIILFHLLLFVILMYSKLNKLQYKL